MRPATVWTGVGVVALGLYPVLIHHAVVSGQGNAAVMALAMVQAAAAGLAVGHLSRRHRWVALAVVLALGVLSWNSARDGLLAASGINHALIHGSLLAFFGRTLAKGREALITTVARRVRGSLTPEMEVYTRRVTWAWCAFFAVQLSVSLLLFLFAPDTVWSFFVNVLDLPLIATMFLLEYGYRLCRFWNHSHGSVADVVRVFVEQPRR